MTLILQPDTRLGRARANSAQHRENLKAFRVEVATAKAVAEQVSVGLTPEWHRSIPVALRVDYVSDIQRLAREIGILLPVTGELDQVTIQWVRTFQAAFCLGEYRESGLTVDGIPGPKTAAAVALCRERKLRVSEDFYWRSFMSKEPNKRPTKTNPIILLDRELILGLQAMREFIAAPIIIVSGFRSGYWNAIIGGSKRSQHLVGKAADISTPGSTPTNPILVERIARRWFSGVGTARRSGRVSHVDVRSWVARWTYPPVRGVDY